MKLRSYQQEDVDLVIAAHQEHQCVLGRAATGLGKGLEIAHLAQHYSRVGRVMVLADMGKLIHQLDGTITRYCNIKPGVEMADKRAEHGNNMLPADPIVVSTVQTQYSGEEGHERFRSIVPTEWSALILDETETFLAPKAREVVQWFIDGNPALRVYGTSATPFRTDGIAMAELFGHVAFDRDVAWGIREGWLVPAQQAFVRVSLDFSTLKIRKDDDEEEDYSDAEIAERINNEAVMIELAKGIHHVAGDKKSIIVTPSIAVAEGIAHYLCADKPKCAEYVSGDMGEKRFKMMEEHAKGEFQYMASAGLLLKGYDDPSIHMVFMCRPTKSRRLYQQVLGRGSRPLRELAHILGDLATAEERRAAIAASEKSQMVMVNMVGISDAVRDIELLDILGVGRSAEEIARAKELEKEGMSAEDALDQAAIDIGADEEAARAADEEQQAQFEADDELAAQRQRVQIDANVEVEYRDGIGYTSGGNFATNSGPIPQGQLNILRKAKISEAEIGRLTPEQASAMSREIVARWKTGACSFKQSRLLKRCGWSDDEVRNMDFKEASACIYELSKNGWRRPRTAV
jgi:superfamily II DNA or RNA helicase